MDEPKMEVVRRIFHMVGEEGCSLNQVRQALEKDGIPTNRGSASWRITTIKRLITHDIYKPHTYEEVMTLLAPETVELLEREGRLHRGGCFGVI